jgi:hypothetical protein
MSIDAALACAIRLIDEQSGTTRATAYVTENVLYIGPRKLGSA